MSRYSREYGVLSFTSDHGLYDNVESYGAGDSGVYPGSGPEGHCARYGIELRHINSHDNTLGYSGTAGNGIWVHDSKFHHNATGLTTDSFAFGHPGMPQDCAKWERNEIYSNNNNLFDDERDAYCKTTTAPCRSATRRSSARRSRPRWAPASASSAATATSSATTGSTTTGAMGRSCSGCPRTSAGSATRARRSTPPSTTSTATTTWGCARTARAIPTATTSGGTRRAAATAGWATPAPAARRRRATCCSGCPAARLADPPAGQPGEDRRPGDVLAVGSAGRPARRPAGLRLVQDAAGAVVRRGALAALLAALALGAGLLVVSVVSGGDGAGDDTGPLRWSGRVVLLHPPDAADRPRRQRPAAATRRCGRCASSRARTSASSTATGATCRPRPCSRRPSATGCSTRPGCPRPGCRSAS